MPGFLVSCRALWSAFLVSQFAAGRCVAASADDFAKAPQTLAALQRIAGSGFVNSLLDERELKPVREDQARGVCTRVSRHTLKVKALANEA